MLYLLKPFSPYMSVSGNNDNHNLLALALNMDILFF